LTPQIESQLVFAIERQASIPVYDCVCHDCHKTFELIRTLNKHEEDAKYPKCAGKDVEQKVTAFYAVAAKKS
jgi:putative FmdB family regulatory protein